MRRKPPAAMAYQLPEEEYHALQRARDHLRLLAGLTEPRNFADDQDLRLSPLALTDCFQRLADDLDDIVRVAWWPGG
ncbi:XAC0095 family protein [Lysobacter sp. P5_B9]